MCGLAFVLYIYFTTYNCMSAGPLSQFSVCDVKRMVVSITSNAVGTDYISRNKILPILDKSLPVICHILNYTVSKSVFPSAWKLAQIIPLPKKYNPSSLSAYPPISTLPFFSKIHMRLIYIQLSSYLMLISVRISLQ